MRRLNFLLVLAVGRVPAGDGRHHARGGLIHAVERRIFIKADSGHRLDLNQSARAADQVTRVTSNLLAAVDNPSGTHDRMRRRVAIAPLSLWSRLTYRQRHDVPSYERRDKRGASHGQAPHCPEAPGPSGPPASAGRHSGHPGRDIAPERNPGSQSPKAEIARSQT